MGASAEHAYLSASGAPGWARCPGKPAAEAQYPDSTSDAALEGTCAHWVAERCLTEGLDPESFVGTVYSTSEGAWTVDQEIAHYVQEYMDNVRSIAADMDVHMVEQRVSLESITGEAGAQGTADYIAVGDRVIQVHDLKFGKGVRVEAEHNEQFVMYAYGALEVVELLYDVDEDWQVEIYVHQPRLDHLPEWHLSVWALRDWAQELSIAAEKTKRPDAPRIPGEKQCRFCKHRPHCKELYDYVERTVADELPLVAEEPGTPEMDALEAALPRLKMIRDWCASVEAQALHLLESGVPVGDWKLVAGRGSRKWALPDDEVEKKLRNRGLRQKDFMKQQLASPAQIEKMLDKKKWEKLSRELVTKTEGKPTIAPGTDNRPAVNTADAVGFEDVSNDDWMG